MITLYFLLNESWRLLALFLLLRNVWTNVVQKMSIFYKFFISTAWTRIIIPKTMNFAFLQTSGASTFEHYIIVCKCHSMPLTLSDCPSQQSFHFAQHKWCQHFESYLNDARLLYKFDLCELSLKLLEPPVPIWSRLKWTSKAKLNQNTERNKPFHCTNLGLMLARPVKALLDSEWEPVRWQFFAFDHPIAELLCFQHLYRIPKTTKLYKSTEIFIKTFIIEPGAIEWWNYEHWQFWQLQ